RLTRRVRIFVEELDDLPRDEIRALVVERVARAHEEPEEARRVLHERPGLLRPRAEVSARVLAPRHREVSRGVVEEHRFGELGARRIGPAVLAMAERELLRGEPPVVTAKERVVRLLPIDARRGDRVRLARPAVAPPVLGLRALTRRVVV